MKKIFILFFILLYAGTDAWCDEPRQSYIKHRDNPVQDYINQHEEFYKKLSVGGKQPIYKRNPAETDCKITAELAQNDFLRECHFYKFFTQKGMDENTNRLPEYQLPEVDTREEMQLRNTCINALSFAIRACVLDECSHEEYNHYLPKINHWFRGDFNIDDLCNWANAKSIDCWNDSMENITTFLLKLEPKISEFVLYSMDSMTQKILNGHAMDALVRIRGHTQTCYATDSNGDTIWHTLIRANMEMYDAFDRCYEFMSEESEKKLSMMIYAIFFEENDAGETAFSEAVRLGRQNEFTYLTHSLDTKDCQALLDELLDTPGVTQSDLVGICKE